MNLNINIETLKGLSNKEIAKALKKELKAQTGVKFSVTSSIYSINCSCNDVAFEANKDIIKEVAGMFTKCTSDTIYINSRIAYYSDTKEYKENQQRKYKQQQLELEKERQEREKLYNDNVIIEDFDYNNVKVVNVEEKNIFVTALEPSINKNNWKVDNDKYIDESSYLNKYKITDIVYMNESNYNYFCFNLLNDYDFLADKGGTWSNDETGIVEYHCAVCIYCEGKEPVIIDPQGFSYARYTNRLTEDFNGDLQREIDKELNINNTSYLEVLNNINITDLYIYSKNTWEYLDKKIINDNRFIYDDYTSNVVITGLTYKELLKEGNRTKLHLEKLHHNSKLLMENIIKCETGAVQTLFVKSKLETVFKGIKFSERLVKELERASSHKPTPEPPKTTKKDNKNNLKEKQDNGNIISVDFTKSKETILNKSSTSWEEKQATKKQLYALYCITKIKTTNLKISKGQASKLISKSKKGKDIKADLKELISIQNTKEVII